MECRHERHVVERHGRVPLCSLLLMVGMAMRLWALMTMVMMSRSIRLSMKWYGGSCEMVLAHGRLAW